MSDLVFLDALRVRMNMRSRVSVLHWCKKLGVQVQLEKCTDGRTRAAVYPSDADAIYRARGVFFRQMKNGYSRIVVRQMASIAKRQAQVAESRRRRVTKIKNDDESGINAHRVSETGRADREEC